MSTSKERLRYELTIERVPYSMKNERLKEKIESILKSKSQNGICRVSETKYDMNNNNERKITIQFDNKEAFDTIASNTFLPVDNQVFKIIVEANKKHPIGPFRFQIDQNDYPMPLIEHDEQIKFDFKSTLSKKLQSNIRLIGNNQIEVEKRTDSKIDPTYEMIKEELNNLRAKHFDTYKINKVEIETISRSILPKINSLLKSDDSGKRFIVNDFIQSIEIYGLKSCVDTMRSKIIEVIYDERIKNEPQSKELSSLMSWQTSYFVRFIGEDAILRIDPKLNLIADEKKITINGRKEAVERAYFEIDNQIRSIRRDEMKLDRHLLEYFISTDLIKLNQLINEKQLKIVLTKSNSSIHMVGGSQATLLGFNHMIQRRFSSGQCEISSQSPLDLVKFEEFLKGKQVELKTSELERKQMIRVTNKSVVCAGERNLVDEWLIHIRKYLDENCISTIDLSSSYEDEKLRYFSIVAHEEIDKLNKQATRDLHIAQPLELVVEKKLPSFRLTCNPVYFDKYLDLFTKCALSMISEVYRLKTNADVPMLALFKEQRISDEIKTIERRIPCVIILKEVTNYSNNQNKIALHKTENDLAAAFDYDLYSNNSTTNSVYEITDLDSYYDEYIEESPLPFRCQLNAVESENEQNFDEILHLLVDDDDLSILLTRVEDFITDCSLIGFRSIGIELYESSAIAFDNLVTVVVGTVIDMITSDQLNDLIDSITFVCDHQKQVVLDFLKEYRSMRKTMSKPIKRKISSPSRSPIAVSNEAESSIKYSSVNLIVYMGNILEAQTECILNPTNDKIDMSGQVSALLLNAEPRLSREVESLRQSFKDFGVSSTLKNPSLKFSLICHLDTSNKEEVKPRLIRALTYMNSLKCKSMTLPLIGAGRANISPQECCRQLNEAIKEYSSSATTLILNEIRVCLHMKEHYDAFINEISRVNTTRKDTVASSSLSSSIEAAATTTAPSIAFKLISDKQERIDEAKKALEAISHREIQVVEHEDDSYDQSNAKLIQDIEKLCEANNVKFIWDFNSKKIKVYGAHISLSTALIKIIRATSTFNKTKQNDLAAKLISQKVQWQVEKNQDWQPFNLYLNTQLEIKHMSKDSSASNNNSLIRLLDERNNYFTADVDKYTLIYDNKPTKVYRIRRAELVINTRFPTNWSTTQSLELVKLAPNSTEYTQTLNLFQSRGLNGILKNVISIERIENRFLYTQYISQKEYLQNKCSSQSIEKTLFHGTNEDCVESIWRTGFNRSYAGKNATAFGRGVYFAREASYSHQFTDIRKGKPIGHMFVCKVLVGKYAIGSALMNIPPDDSDCTVDNMTNPLIYVIYKDAQAYPDYLITYQ